MNDEMRAWRCENGHVMGLAGRSGAGITRLWLYRHAIDLETEEPLAPEVMAIIEGQVYDIYCDVCGAVRTWVQGEEPMKRLLESVGKNREEEK